MVILLSVNDADREEEWFSRLVGLPIQGRTSKQVCSIMYHVHRFFAGIAMSIYILPAKIRNTNYGISPVDQFLQVCQVFLFLFR